MDSETIFNALNQIKISIDQHKDEIEKLDQEIGDGDHIFNIQRGIKESLNLKDELSEQSPSEVLKKIGMKIMTTVGGSSGALFATLLIGMAKRYNDELSDQKNVAKSLDFFSPLTYALCILCNWWSGQSGDKFTKFRQGRGRDVIRGRDRDVIGTW